jgi:choline dehydrogenase-like flavoprotein
MNDFDVCVIGSGAGGGAVAAALAAAGKRVVVIEKGPWLGDGDFRKDEIGASRRSMYSPDRRAQPHVVETYDADEGWQAYPTTDTGWDFWNGTLVGGASNLMSGFFHRKKPQDFRLLSEYGPIAGANIADWPITYDDLEPWYAQVESIIGVSGRVPTRGLIDRRSTPTFPQPPLGEHPLTEGLERAAAALGLTAQPVPRAILSQPRAQRGSCAYTGFCAEYGCATGAKGSSRVALLQSAVASGRCEIRPGCMAQRIATDTQGRITHVEYRGPTGDIAKVSAGVYVVACQAIETARLLLLSTGPKHPRGLGNNRGQVGQNLIFSTAAWATAELPLASFDEATRLALRSPLPWLNRAIADLYELRDGRGTKPSKGGMLEFMLGHPNFIGNAVAAAFDGDRPVWGPELLGRLQHRFGAARRVVVEVFADWLPTPEGRVSLDPAVKDIFGLAVARVRIDKHPRNKQVADRLLDRGVEVLKRMGGRDLYRSSRGAPSTNLPAGTCRMGGDPRSSVVDASCRVHELDNLYIADASTWPTGGSVPPTWTVYANALRIAHGISGR